MLRFPDFRKRRLAASAFGVPRSGKGRADAGPGPEASGVRVRLDDLVRLCFRASALTYPPSQRLSSPFSGAYRSIFRGRGMEFEEVRIYQPGDDIRNMDWRVTARTGKPHTKLFQEERQRATFILVDLNPAMAFGTRRAFKSVAAMRAAALLAWAAMANGDRVGGMALAPGEKLLHRPASGSRGVLPLLNALIRHQPEPGSGTPPVRLADALVRMQAVVRPGSLIFLFSDFSTLDADAGRHIGRLARHNDLALIHVHDPLERHLPPSGRFAFSDGRATVTVESAEQESAHAGRFDERRQRVVALGRRFGARVVDLETGESVLAQLRQGLGPAFGRGGR